MKRFVITSKQDFEAVTVVHSRLSSIRGWEDRSLTMTKDSVCNVDRLDVKEHKLWEWLCFVFWNEFVSTVAEIWEVAVRCRGPLHVFWFVRLLPKKKRRVGPTDYEDWMFNELLSGKCELKHGTNPNGTCEINSSMSEEKRWRYLYMYGSNIIDADF